MRTAWVLVLIGLLACGEDGGGGNPADTGGSDRGGDGGVQPPDYDPPAALAALVDVDELHNRDSLEIAIDTARSGRVPGDFAEPVWQIGLTFRSQTFLGQVWEHDAVLVLPDDLSAATGAAAVVQRNTENPVTGVSDPANFLPQYAAITADRLDMPILLLEDVPPAVDLRQVAELSEYADDLPGCFAGVLSDAARFRDCLWELSRLTGRLDLFPALPVAVAYVRAVTALQEMAELTPTLNLSFDPPAFSVDSAALFASGLGGLAMRHAMALDGRIAGVLSAGADLGDLPAFFNLQADVWASDYPFGPPADHLAFFGTAPGAGFLEAFDLGGLGASLEDRSYFMAVGTNDPTTPLQAYSVYADDLPADRGQLYVASSGAGLGTADHLAAWRVFLAHVYRGRPLADVSTTFADQNGNVTVTAQVSGDTIVQTVELFYVQRHQTADDTDYRDAIWRGQAMVEDGLGGYTTAFPNTLANTAFFVRVFDSQDIYEGAITSEVTIYAP